MIVGTLAPTYHPTKIFILSHTNRYTHLLLIYTLLTINILKRKQVDSSNKEKNETQGHMNFNYGFLCIATENMLITVCF